MADHRGRALVVCLDGPRAGAWYFEDDWRDMRGIAILNAWRFPDEPAQLLGYVPSTRRARHPEGGRGRFALDGAVWLWRP